MSSQANPQASRPSVPALFAEWIRQGAEGFIATQKILLDLAAQQNALALTIVKERMSAIKLPTPSKALVELAARGVENFMEAQKVLLDLAARQNQIVADGLKPSLAGTPVEGIAEIMRQGVDAFLAAQKRFLDVAESQTEAAVNAYKEGKPMDGSRLAELANEGIRAFAENQKKFLDTVTEQIGAKKTNGSPAPDEKKRADLFEMARLGVDSFIEAQKRLLDLASDQVGVNVQFAKEVFSMGAAAPAAPVTSLSDIMRKSVDSFVAAQKALMELASKPRETKEAPQPETATA